MKRHQWLPWVIVLAVVVIAVAIVTSLDRFVEWDEAVFYSQSGGFKGTSPPQLPLAPSREGGPGFLIGVIRVSGLGLIGVRVVFVAIALSIAGFAYWRLSHHFSRLAGPSALAAFGLSWLSLAYLGSLYGSVLNGVLLVLAAVLLIDIAFGELPTSRLIGLGLLLGLAVSGARFGCGRSSR